MVNKKAASGCLLLALAASLGGACAQAHANADMAVGLAPPPIRMEFQPPCPGPGYLWTPGHWAYDPLRGYYWVAGVWLLAPLGELWTPGYWAWEGLGYHWHPGYWGRRVGYYGGVNYGYGYFGRGYSGAYWRGGRLVSEPAWNHLHPSLPGFAGERGWVHSAPARFNEEHRAATANARWSERSAGRELGRGHDAARGYGAAHSPAGHDGGAHAGAGHHGAEGHRR